MSDYMDLPLTGLECPLNDMEAAVQDNVHRFAEQVMRPAGQRLDRLAPEELIADGSELWEVLHKAGELGLDLSRTLSCHDPATDGAPCQRCDACLLRAKGFEEAGVPDPALVSSRAR